MLGTCLVFSENFLKIRQWLRSGVISVGRDSNRTRFWLDVIPAAACGFGHNGLRHAIQTPETERQICASASTLITYTLRRSCLLCARVMSPASYMSWITPSSMP